MGWGNPPIPWSELERRLAGRRKPDRGPAYKPEEGDGGDSPGWSRKRQSYQPVELPPPPADQVSYAELHCHSNFSFLDGASEPEELAEEAVQMTAFEDFVTEKVKEGRSILGLYPATDPKTLDDFAVWKKANNR